MTFELEVIEPGLANTVQDGGRFGHRAIGVPVGGALDGLLPDCANHLAGNPAEAAAIEIVLAGPTLEAVAAPVRVALAGAVRARVTRADGQAFELDGHSSLTLRRGDRLQVGAVQRGVAYLAVSGGCQVPPQLGSRSTDLKAGLGGVQGRALARGDRIPCGPPGEPSAHEWQAPPWAHGDGPIRVIWGPQDDAFEPAAREALLAGAWRCGRECDRMGVRLEGPRLAHRTGRGADITSEGVVPGAIQVPGNGQPIVLRADAQTVGGYTKIATVIRADLPRLGQLRAGDAVRFAAVSRAQALQALADVQQAWRHWAAQVQPWRPPGMVDLEALRTGNLVSGMIDTRRDTLPWETEP